MKKMIFAIIAGVAMWSMPASEAKAQYPFYYGGYYNYYGPVVPTFQYNRINTYANPFGYRAFNATGFYTSPFGTNVYRFQGAYVRPTYVGPNVSLFYNPGLGRMDYGPGYRNAYPTYSASRFYYGW